MNRLRRFGRALLLALIGLFFRRSPRPPPPISLDAVRKILVVRTDTRVGNVLLTTPLVRALRQGLPQARVDFLVAAGKEHLVQGLAGRVWPFAKRDFFRAPWRFWSFMRALRAERYDVAVDASHWHTFSFTSAFVTYATGARVRIGHDRGPAERFLTHPVTKDPRVLRDVAAKLELLVPLGLPDAGEALETTVDRDPRVQAQADALLAAFEGPVVSLNPGARKRDYRWSARGFGALARVLRERQGAIPLVLWGPGEEGLAREVVEASGAAAVLAPATDLPLLAAVFRRSAVVVTNDTGPMHLAVATGVPVVAALVQEDGARWSHAGERFAGVPVKGDGAEDVEAVAQAVRKSLVLSP